MHLCTLFIPVANIWFTPFTFSFSFNFLLFSLFVCLWMHCHLNCTHSPGDLTKTSIAVKNYEFLLKKSRFLLIVLKWMNEGMILIFTWFSDSFCPWLRSLMRTFVSSIKFTQLNALKSKKKNDLINLDQNWLIEGRKIPIQSWISSNSGRISIRIGQFFSIFLKHLIVRSVARLIQSTRQMHAVKFVQIEFAGEEI